MGTEQGSGASGDSSRGSWLDELGARAETEVPYCAQFGRYDEVQRLLGKALAKARGEA